MPIPQDLHQPLFHALRHCPHLQSNEALRALFVIDQLSPWQPAVSDADTIELRASLLVASLAEQYTSKNENVLVLFLRVLAERTHPNDSLHAELMHLAQALAQATYIPAPASQERPVEIDPAPSRPGLIVVVSPGKSTPDNPSAAESAVQHHIREGQALRYCWLLAGPGEEDVSSTANAVRLQQELATQQVTTEIWHLDNIDDIEELFRKMHTIVQVARYRYGLRAEDIVADYTGGTKSMTLAMALAAQVTGIRLQFLKPLGYLENGYADRTAGSRAVQVDIPFVRVTAI